MQNTDQENDYTRHTFMAIAFVVAIVTLFSLNIDLLSQANQSSESFQSNSISLLIFRIMCFFVGIYAVYNMFICGPGNMMVVIFERSTRGYSTPARIRKICHL